MAITLDGSGGLFTRLGAIGGAWNVVQCFRGNPNSALATDLPTKLANVMAQYDGGTVPIRDLVDRVVAANSQGVNALTGVLATLRQAARDTLIRMVNDDNPQPAETVELALAELRRQMIAGSETIKKNTVSISGSAGGSNVGNGTIVASIQDPDGNYSEYALAEDIAMDVTATTSGGGTWRCRGEYAIGDKISPSWPAGSGKSATLASTHAGSSSNLVTNGTFESFTGNTPDDWTVVTGTAGTHFGPEATNFYRGAKALKFMGDGSTLTCLKQELTGLLPGDVLSFSVAHRMSAAAAAGAAVFELVDGSNTVIDTEAGANNDRTSDLTALGTTYTWLSQTFHLPDPLPSNVYLRIRLTTAIENSKNWLIDELQIKTMTRLYDGGPYLAAISGATDWSGDDTYTMTVANNYGGKFQTAFEQWFDIGSLGILIPSDASPTISEGLFA